MLKNTFFLNKYLRKTLILLTSKLFKILRYYKINIVKFSIICLFLQYFSKKSIKFTKCKCIQYSLWIILEFCNAREEKTNIYDDKHLLERFLDLVYKRNSKCIDQWNFVGKIIIFYFNEKNIRLHLLFKYLFKIELVDFCPVK